MKGEIKNMRYKCIKSFYAKSKDAYGFPTTEFIAEGTIWDTYNYSYSSIMGQLVSMVNYYPTCPTVEIFSIDRQTLNEHFVRY